MKKILSIARTPITTYPHTANIAAILWDNARIYPWLLGRFINLYGLNNEDMDYEDCWILDCPAIQYKRIDKREIRRSWKKIGTFIKKSIDEEYYIYLPVDTGMITAYGERQHPHDMLIFGYDDERKIFHIADFFQGKRYGFSTASYTEVENALQQSLNYWIFNDDIILMKVNQDAVFSFEPSSVCESIREYLDASKTKTDLYSRVKYFPSLFNKGVPEKFIYGMDCYKIIYNYLLNNDNFELQHNIQVFHLFSEHKEVMYERINYMGENRYLKNYDYYCKKYKNIFDKARLCQTYYIKFIITEKPEILKRIYKIVKVIESEECTRGDGK